MIKNEVIQDSHNVKVLYWNKITAVLQWFGLPEVFDFRNKGGSMSGFDDLITKGLNQGSLSSLEIKEGLLNEQINPSIIQEFIEKIQKLGILYYPEKTDLSKTLKELMEQARSQGFIDKQEIMDAMPEILEIEQVNDMIEMMTDMGINII